MTGAMVAAFRAASCQTQVSHDLGLHLVNDAHRSVAACLVSELRASYRSKVSGVVRAVEPPARR